MTEDEEIQKQIDSAVGYYLGLWNILENDKTPPSVIINTAVNHMLSVIDRYMTGERKLELLETITNEIKKETSLEVNKQH